MSEDTPSPAPAEDTGQPAPAGARLILVMIPFLVVVALMLLEGWLRNS
jgi:hypothetical protein